ncbi:MAG: S41 family peptidase, partial [Alistipes sp.]
DMRTAIEQLRASGQLQGLILDYRSNGGGILQEAVKILSMFVPKGTEVVTTKGRIENKSFRTSSEPILPNLPLIVLVNGNTASAAEIVAGALQDLDRAVVIGQKSFGKGLVQSTRPLGYNAFLKLTTAKYYIPSGRCIQAIDYSHAQDGTVKIVPDSLISEFTTKGGRKVYNSGGIMPDLRTEPEYSSRFAMTLYVMGFLDDFGDRYMQAHPTQTVNSRTFALTDADYADFERFMQDKKVDYESDTRRALKALRKAAETDRYTQVSAEIDALEKGLKDDTATNLQTYRKEITEMIEADIVLRHSYVAGVIERNITGRDAEVTKAIEIVTNPQEYTRIVTEQDTQKK